MMHQANDTLTKAPGQNAVFPRQPDVSHESAASHPPDSGVKGER